VRKGGAVNANARAALWQNPRTGSASPRCSQLSGDYAAASFVASDFEVVDYTAAMSCM
jgi:hypothetical protein